MSHMSRWWEKHGAIGVLTALLIAPACVEFGVDDYEEFRGAVKAGASCDELFDIQENLPQSVNGARVERDLRKIGCESRDSKRTDE